MNGTLARGDGIAEAAAMVVVVVEGAGATRSAAKLIQRNTLF
jgi:hypothetical protein